MQCFSSQCVELFIEGMSRESIKTEQNNSSKDSLQPLGRDVSVSLCSTTAKP